MRLFLPRGMKRKFIRWFYTKKAMKKVAFFKSPPVVNKKTKLSKNTYLGSNCHFNGMLVNGDGKITIGDNFHSGEDCLMISQNHNIHGNEIPYDDTYILKDIKIDDNVWLGSRVIILGGVEIGEGAVIQAGSVVVSNIPPLSIAGGHPAKVFSQRDREHYYEMKMKKRFH